ncbi:tRNA (adenine(22)-N(1))-methyltransferase [Paenibacillus aquistagni]|uniref:tRNA (Adenine22-N1)-methyltransferase n=1 Tax=Paenibacillus aquistagni TaxID=1852522 RepID=A0A1X7IF73_9BACL|nr:class I SAM-dependent methyltransferase [Paenibacillus aquistagni]SMG12885.1 tRNA (adenine22-N1)-methyltransferase [Paenibacillus aquistagni]
MKLSRRLQCIADLVPKGSRMADIGSDHALLPAYLVKVGIVPFAVAGEVNQGPYEAALRQVKGSLIEDQVQVRLGDGLAVLTPNEVDCITIAGMGGSLIASILDKDSAKLEGVSTLVLQPNVGEEFVRSWLSKHGWLLVEEHILEEDGKIYEILLAVKQDEDTFSVEDKLLYTEQKLGNVTLDRQWLMQLGPHLIREPNDILIRKWSSEIAKQDKILATMAATSSEEVKVKREQFEAYKKALEEIVACWQKDRRSFNGWKN